MVLELFDLSLIQARLQSSVEALALVGEAADFIAVSKDAKPVKTPSAWVIPSSESADSNTLSGAVSQRVKTRFGVVYAVKNVNDKAGARRIAGLRELRNSTLSALVGYEPEGTDGQVEFVSGRLMQFDTARAILWWMDEFTLDIYLRG